VRESGLARRGTRLSIHIALLRAVNVGGTAKMPMAELRALCERLGLKSVRTLLHSGNLVFEAGSRSPAACEKLLQAACAKAFSLETDIYVRTPGEIEAVLARNPFPAEARDDPAHLHVLFLRAAPDPQAFKTLQAAIKGRETVRGVGREAYIVYPDGAGTSKLTLRLIEKHLGTTGTMRNWNTVGKLAVLMKA
jgi:uncharacterized protein (DUF1697 family)